jgi:hypothetical protein
LPGWKARTAEPGFPAASEFTCIFILPSPSGNRRRVGICEQPGRLDKQRASTKLKRAKTNQGRANGGKVSPARLKQTCKITLDPLTTLIVVCPRFLQIPVRFLYREKRCGCWGAYHLWLCQALFHRPFSSITTGL